MTLAGVYDTSGLCAISVRPIQETVRHELEGNFFSNALIDDVILPIRVVAESTVGVRLADNNGTAITTSVTAASLALTRVASCELMLRAPSRAISTNRPTTPTTRTGRAARCTDLLRLPDKGCVSVEVPQRGDGAIAACVTHMTSIHNGHDTTVERICDCQFCSDKDRLIHRNN